MIAFYNGLTGWIDKGRAVDAVYCKASDTVCHRTLKAKLKKYGMDDWTVKWKDRAQRVAGSVGQSLVGG